MNNSFSLLGLSNFLSDYPRMSVSPEGRESTILKGDFDFLVEEPKSRKLKHCSLTDSYKLKISVPLSFPKNLPTVFELDNRINVSTACGHLYDNKSLCLGNPLRLLYILHSEPDPDLVIFSEKILVPYLYAISYYRKYKVKMVLGEINHSPTSLLKDTAKLFGITDKVKLINTLRFLANNKQTIKFNSCPCGCKKDACKCKTGKVLNCFLSQFSNLEIRNILKTYDFHLHKLLDQPIVGEYESNKLDSLKLPAE